MSSKFEIDQLEERIAPTTVGVGGLSAGVTANDTVSIGLPLIGNVSVGINANDSVTTSGLTSSLSGLPILGGLLGGLGL